MNRALFLIMVMGESLAWGSMQMRLPAPSLEKLPNGLEIVWYIQDSIPFVTLHLQLPQGYRDDPEGKSGTTQLLAASLLRGSAGRSMQAVEAEIEQRAAVRYVQEDDEGFGVGIRGLALDSDFMLQELSATVLKPAFESQEIRSERDKIAERMRHLPEYAEALAGLVLSRELYRGTAYERGGIATLDEFNRLGAEDVVQLWKSRFRPEGARLLVIGKVDRKKFGERIRSLFGDSWPASGTLKTSEDPNKKFSSTGGRFLILTPGKTQAQFRAAVRVESGKEILGSRDYYARRVVNASLGEMFQSRLNSVIRDELGLTYGIGSQLSYHADMGSWSISASTKGETVFKVIQKTQELWEKLKKECLSAQEIQDAKAFISGGFPLTVTTLEAIATRWLAGAKYGDGDLFLKKSLDGIEAVTKADVLRVCTKMPTFSQFKLVVAGSQSPELMKLKTQGFRQVEAQDYLHEKRKSPQNSRRIQF